MREMEPERDRAAFAAVRLIGIDVDGTLVNSKNELTKATVSALQQAADRGIEIALSTGRMASECRELLARLPMIRYIVTCTGSQVIDLRTGQTLFRRSLTADQLRSVCGPLIDLDALLQVFDDRDGFIHNDARRLAEAERYCTPQKAAAARRCHVGEADFPAYLAAYEGPANKIHIFFASADAKEEARRRLAGLPYACMESVPNDLEVMPRDVDKGVGLRALAACLGLRPAQVMAVGDGGNDVGMLDFAGVSVCMGNGSEEARRHARFVTAANDGDGLALAIRRLLAAG